MNKFIQIIRRLFTKPDIIPSFSFGERGKDGFAPIIKDGVKTNCRMYLWDKSDLDKLIEIGKNIRNKKLQNNGKG